MPSKRTPTLNSYKGMLQRCLNPNNPAYHRYGGRGVTVCEAWRGPGGFAQFVADMGERPAGLTLDRIDNDGPYAPENCRWASWADQGLNRGTTRRVEWDGKVWSTSALAREYGINRSVLNHRLAHRWPVEKALFTPVGPAPIRRDLIPGYHPGCGLTLTRRAA